MSGAAAAAAVAAVGGEAGGGAARRRFAAVAVGGTFDRLHDGHRQLLAAAALAVAPNGRLVVGVTGDELLRSKKHRELIQPYETRAAVVRAFLLARQRVLQPADSASASAAASAALAAWAESQRVAAAPTASSSSSSSSSSDAGAASVAGAAADADPDGGSADAASFLGDGTDGPFEVELVQLSEPMGPAGTDAAVAAIVVSPESVKGADMINAARAERGLPQMEVLTIDFVANRAGLDPTDSKLSSGSLRERDFQRAQAARRAAAWQADVVAPLGLSAALAERWLSSLSERYSEPQRAYHTLTHIDELLALLEEHRQVVAAQHGGGDGDGSSSEAASGGAARPPRVQDVPAVALAIWFHDAIYEPKAAGGANERESAQLFQTFVDEVVAGLDAADADARRRWSSLRSKVYGYIIDTWKHQPASAPDDEDLKLFLDMDCAILGADPDRYRRYAAEIRFEYSHVPEADFRSGRAAVLAQLAQGGVYTTDLFNRLRGDQARSNMDAEAAMLKAGEPLPKL